MRARGIVKNISMSLPSHSGNEAPRVKKILKKNRNQRNRKK
jgi:hypothetical protein